MFFEIVFTLIGVGAGFFLMYSLFKEVGLLGKIGSAMVSYTSREKPSNPLKKRMVACPEKFDGEKPIVKEYHLEEPLGYCIVVDGFKDFFAGLNAQNFRAGDPSNPDGIWVVEWNKLPYVMGKVGSASFPSGNADGVLSELELLEEVSEKERFLASPIDAKVTAHSEWKRIGEVIRDMTPMSLLRKMNQQVM